MGMRTCIAATVLTPKLRVGQRKRSVGYHLASCPGRFPLRRFPRTHFMGEWIGSIISVDAAEKKIILLSVRNLNETD